MSIAWLRRLPDWLDEPTTARLVLRDGTVIAGMGIGATGAAVGELCFNTAMTGYQEILTDPSYVGQIIAFTFPHIGNVGVNDEDGETSNLSATSRVRGCVLRGPITAPSNYRARDHFNTWLGARGIIAISGVDTRALTARIRDFGMQGAVIAHEPSGEFDEGKLLEQARAFPGLDGMDLVPSESGMIRPQRVSCFPMEPLSKASALAREAAPSVKSASIRR